MIINTNDFVGVYSLSKNQYTKALIQGFIETLEPSLLYGLLGKELGDLYLADLDVNGVPQTQRFLDLYDPFYLEINGVHYNSNGLNDVLIGFIYHSYMVDDNLKHTISGTVSVKGEVSERPSTVAMIRKAETRFNTSVSFQKSIQTFICNDKIVYPEYNGVQKSVKFLGLI